MDYQTLKKLFQDRDKNVRLFCLKAAIRDNTPNSEEFILEGLRDGRPEVVCAALRASKITQNSEIVGMIITYLESPNTVLKSESLYALESKNTKTVKKAICDFLKEKKIPLLLPPE